MVNRDLLATKWVELAQRLAQVRKHRKATLDELQADRDAAELVAFNLMLAVQVCADKKASGGPGDDTETQRRCQTGNR